MTTRPSAPRGKESAKRRAPAPKPPGSKPATRRAWVPAALAALLVAGAVAGWRATHANRPSPASAADDSLRTLSPAEAYAEGLRLMREHRSDVSLRYFRYSLAAVPDAPAPVHYNYSTAIYNVLFDPDARGNGGHVGFANSLERTQASRECLEQMTLAVAGSRSPADRAKCCDQVARMLSTFGFEWEALAWSQQAATLAPQRADYLRRHDGLLALLAHPGKRVLRRPDDPAPNP